MSVTRCQICQKEIPYSKRFCDVCLLELKAENKYEYYEELAERDEHRRRNDR